MSRTKHPLPIFHFRNIAIVFLMIVSCTLLAIDTFAAGSNEPLTPTPVVKTQSGEVRGKIVGGVYQYLGIPFAAPPVGDLRWRPPVPHPSWDGVLEATRTRAWCPQLSATGLLKVYGSEDCLYLNIYTPKPATPRPVMLWIHGGSFLVGSGAPFNGSNLVRDGNLIVVTINYRLGVLGYLASRALDATDPRHTSGNYALLDQGAAIRWVVDNIAAFGGDPRNVTVAGESAGAMSAGLLMVTPSAAGTFQRAILESGPYLQTFQTLAQAEVHGDEIAARLGCANVPDIAKCMRGKTAEQIVDAAPGDPLSWASLIWAPIVDGKVLPSQPARAIAAGRVSKMPLINGSNRDEGTLMFAYGKQVTADHYNQAMHSLLGDRAEEVLAAYPLANYSQPALAAAGANGDAFLSCRINDAGVLLAPQMPVYQYEFNDPNAPPMFFKNAQIPLGSFHSAELQYVFGSIAHDPAATPAQRNLATAMRGYWIRFVTSGDPGGSPRWTPYQANDPKRILFTPGSIAFESDFATIHHCALWNSILK
ncbi:MAG TPA: carboxylesterase/lipase family protein [Candidatus Binataceae bacterium]|nr:carboxylesterase/lipase family protein [Candidatus Binataceae bacterium]